MNRSRTSKKNPNIIAADKEAAAVAAESPEERAASTLKATLTIAINRLDQNKQKKLDAAAKEAAERDAAEKAAAKAALEQDEGYKAKKAKLAEQKAAAIEAEKRVAAQEKAAAAIEAAKKVEAARLAKEAVDKARADAEATKLAKEAVDKAKADAAAEAAKLAKEAVDKAAVDSIPLDNSAIDGTISNETPIDNVPVVDEIVESNVGLAGETLDSASA